MNARLGVACLALALLGCRDGVAGAPSSPDEWPARDLARFVFERLEVASFRNSTGPAREPGKRTFADYGVRPDAVTETRAAAGEKCAKDDPDCWLYAISLIGKDDFNGDGIVDVAVCFTDQAQNGGSYNTRKPLVLQLIAGRVVAIQYELDETKRGDCKPFGGDNTPCDSTDD